MKGFGSTIESPNIASTIAIRIGSRHVYNVIYKGAKNIIVAEKKLFLYENDILHEHDKLLKRTT